MVRHTAAFGFDRHLVAKVLQTVLWKVKVQSGARVEVMMVVVAHPHSVEFCCGRCRSEMLDLVDRRAESTVLLVVVRLPVVEGIRLVFHLVVPMRLTLVVPVIEVLVLILVEYVELVEPIGCDHGRHRSSAR